VAWAAPPQSRQTRASDFSAHQWRVPASSSRAWYFGKSFFRASSAVLRPSSCMFRPNNSQDTFTTIWHHLPSPPAPHFSPLRKKTSKRCPPTHSCRFSKDHRSTRPDFNSSPIPLREFVPISLLLRLKREAVSSIAQAVDQTVSFLIQYTVC